ncbi:MAG: hypothetical protein O7E52_29145 [Candidatus Poribacteria bacterium]|nr:hypothetical protein [Candidatus Poribacteria bacterium]
MPVPITFLVDDSCPLIHVYRFHKEEVHGSPPYTDDGRLLLDSIPNEFLDRFCDVVERHGIAGKFSIIPAPAGRGDILSGIEDYHPSVTREWMDTAKRRLSERFDFCPEMITHNLTADLSTGGYFDEGESTWSQKQDRRTLTPYLTKALEYLKAADIDATGVTSPWTFAMAVEDEYIHAIVAAQQAVYNRKLSWYFLYTLHDKPASKPWIAFQEGDTTLISIPSTVDDFWWQTIDSPRSDPEFVDGIADKIITKDGSRGKVREVLDAGGWPILLTHWQSLFSNGLETGLAVLDEVGKRINKVLAEAVEWKTCSELSRLICDSNPPHKG